MKRVKEEFLNKISSAVSLFGKNVLEVGCGNGSRSEQISQLCSTLVGIDPSKDSVLVAQKKSLKNAIFQQGQAESLQFLDGSFDVVIFTLSLHHVPIPSMPLAISEAVRVVKKDGFVVFLEPAMEGSFFDAEINFDACDGDEREQKKAAYCAMSEHSGLKLIAEIDDETVFQFDSIEDFFSAMTPKKELSEIESFLQLHGYILIAERRINIFQPR